METKDGNVNLPKGKWYRTEQLVCKIIGERFVLQPIDGGFIFEGNRAELLYSMLNLIPDTSIKEYLPGVDFSSPDAINKHFFNICVKSESGLGFAYGIIMGQGLIGIIYVNTPDFNKITIGFNHWTIDFFLAPPFQKGGLMPHMLNPFFRFLHDDLNISRIYAIVDDSNTPCRNMLEHEFNFFIPKPEMTFNDTSRNGKRAICYEGDLDLMSEYDFLSSFSPL